MNHSTRFATVAFCLLLSSNALAHPGHEHHDHESDSKSLRTWTDDTGFFQVQGTFVMAKDGKVQVRTQDDTLSTLPIGRLSEKDQAWIENRLAELYKLNTQFPKLVVAQADTQDTSRETESRDAPPILKNFEPFSEKLKFRWDDDYFYVESNGMPGHQMMVGITAWQQQVPLPQPYTGSNAWRIPLHPVPAKKPMSAKTDFFRGAIALAVNGVPIFNPIKNDGRTDTLLAGELDKWGGHCGRADDYHYHIAPVHLETKDGQLSKQEVVANAERMFTKIDRDSNGKITKAELEAAQRSKDRTPNGKRGGPRQGEGNKGEEQADATETPRPSNVRSPTGSSQTDRPNIVFILIDDMGWKDMGFTGNNFVETPNADRLAREGVIFTQSYSSAPNCAPTRACLLSGQYTPRHGVFTVIDQRHAPGQSHHRILASPSNESMSGDVVTIPEALKTAGYATGCFGMWNLGRGRFGPSTATGQGFDVYKKPQDLGFDRSRYFDDKGRYLTDVLFDEGIRFIEDHAQEPFFLYLPTHAIHAPFEPKPELLAKYKRKVAKSGDRNDDPVYAAMIESVDQNVGRLMQTLERLKLADNTMVVFTSDNGGAPQYVAPLNGSKGALYEGGIRVPAFVWWSGIKQPGRTSSEPISSIDFYPTILSAAGVEAPSEHPLDGQSLLPILSSSGNIERDALYWHFPCYIGKSSPCSAIRMGDYKLIEFFEDNHIELYNLRDDIGETTDLSEEMPDRATKLLSALKTWRSALNAPVPNRPNPDFDVSTLKGRGKNRKRGRRREE